jgi:hypothetical protein
MIGYYIGMTKNAIMLRMLDFIERMIYLAHRTVHPRPLANFSVSFLVSSDC